MAARGNRTRRALVSALAAAVVCLAPGLATSALFSHGVPLTGVITSGDFRFSLGTLAWASSEGASGTGSLNDAVLGDGGTLTITQPITSDFTGNNLQVAMTVSLSNLPSDVAAGTWCVRVAGGGALAGPSATALGTAADVSVVAANTTWDVVITVTMGASTGVYVNPASAPPTATVADLGTLSIAANQVRG